MPFVREVQVTEIIDPERVGQRIRLVRKFAAGLSGPGLAEAMGFKDPALTSRMEAGRSIDREKLEKIGEVCAGRGMLKKTSPEEIVAFLEGRLEELNVVLDGSFYQMSYCGHVPMLLPTDDHAGSNDDARA